LFGGHGSWNWWCFLNWELTVYILDLFFRSSELVLGHVIILWGTASLSFLYPV
jgi:hypothetical protein